MLLPLPVVIHSCRLPRVLHSSPTRRSSDLRLFRCRPPRPHARAAGAESHRDAARFLGKAKGLSRGKHPAPRRRGGTMIELVGFRSEEHTSELQSRENLVCRLLLEKKK